MSYSAKIAHAVDSFLKEDDWRYSFDEEAGIFRFDLRYDGKLQEANFIIHIRDSFFVVYAIPPISAKDCLPEMAEFITRANYGLNSGCFEMDYEDGEIRFRTYVCCQGGVPSPDVIRDGVYVAASTMRRYGDGIVAVAFGAQTPVIAVTACETSSR